MLQSYYNSYSWPLAITTGGKTNSGKDVNPNGRLGFGRTFVISPFFYNCRVNTSNGLHLPTFYFDGVELETTFDLTLAEIKGIKEIKCELSQN